MDRPLCKNCKLRKADVTRHGKVYKNGLCCVCRKKNPGRKPHREPSMAEVEAMVAEQMESLPSWWDTHEAWDGDTEADERWGS